MMTITTSGAFMLPSGSQITRLNTTSCLALEPFQNTSDSNQTNNSKTMRTITSRGAPKKRYKDLWKRLSNVLISIWPTGICELNNEMLGAQLCWLATHRQIVYQAAKVKGQQRKSRTAISLLLTPHLVLPVQCVIAHSCKNWSHKSHAYSCLSSSSNKSCKTFTFTFKIQEIFYKPIFWFVCKKL